MHGKLKLLISFLQELPLVLVSDLGTQIWESSYAKNSGNFINGPFIIIG